MLSLAQADAPVESIQWIAPVLLVAGVVALGVILTMSVRDKLARKSADAPTPRERIDQVKSAARRRVEVETGQSEMLDTARRLAAHLDNKAERLEQLIGEAESCITRLSSLLPTTGTPGRRGGRPAGNGADEPEHALADAVYEMADAGRDAVSIARELDEQVGKVELILALRES
ncbi:MAG: hypothetical protein ACYTG1_12545 [Planctomycetota bacterium]